MTDRGTSRIKAPSSESLRSCIVCVHLCVRERADLESGQVSLSLWLGYTTDYHICNFVFGFSVPVSFFLWVLLLEKPSLHIVAHFKQLKYAF